MPMKTLRLFLLSALGATAISTAASASVVISTVSAGNSDGQFGTIDLAGGGQRWTTPLLLTDSSGKTYVTFCDDLQHEINVAGGQSLPFDLGKVQVDGFGALLGTLGGGAYTNAQYATAESLSNRMGQLADIGRAAYLSHDLQGADAAQAAIWGLEYAQHGWTVTASDPTVMGDLAADLQIRDNGAGWATGLVSTGGAQSQILGSAVPEPATWAMLVLGLGGLGSVLRRRPQAAPALA